MDKFFVYILYSEVADSYYVGQTMDVEKRINEHNAEIYSGAWSSKSSDWKTLHIIECTSRYQAIKIEAHIKKMKSRVYFENLVKYPDITNKLLEKYCTVPGSSR